MEVPVQTDHVDGGAIFLIESAEGGSGRHCDCQSDANRKVDGVQTDQGEIVNEEQLLRSRFGVAGLKPDAAGASFAAMMTIIFRGGG